jgi:hypothetical protein
MDEFRHWLLAAVQTVLDWLGHLLSELARGLTQEWPITYFVIGLVILLVAGMVIVWYRGH